MLPSTLTCSGTSSRPAAACAPSAHTAALVARSRCRIAVPAARVSRRSVAGLITTPVKCASSTAAGANAPLAPRRTAPSAIQGE